LLACHNRREKTLADLGALYGSPGREPEIQLKIFLPYDASTDGAAEAVEWFDPEIHVIKGTDRPYWSRGMILAWKTALQSGKKSDAFLLVNGVCKHLGNSFMQSERARQQQFVHERN
jgi:hypothetical protein